MFEFAVYTEKMKEKGDNFFWVVARGTKKLMQEWMEAYSNNQETIACKIRRKKDKAIVAEYHR